MERITPRHVFEARIRISVRRDPQDLVMEGWARDMSETGLCAFVARSLRIGELVTLEIPLAPLRRLRIPAKVARCVGTQYGFQFTALSHDQRADIQSVVKDRVEIGKDWEAGSRIGEHASAFETGLSTREPETRPTAGTAFSDRARILIKRGYTPKVAVELVLHEVEVEHGNDAKVMEKAHADAKDFLLKVRQGLI